MSKPRFFATTPRGMEVLLAQELADFGATGISTASAGVSFGGGLQAAYRACLWSRIANRVLLSIVEISTPDADALYKAVRSVDWSEHMDCDSTLAVNAHCSKSTITHSQYIALRIKDAIVDQFRDTVGRRPNVDRDTPDIRINAYLHRNRLRLSLDLSGGSLHRRGYRQADSGAPLKENLAAALLHFAGWPEIARNGGRLLDPMCGSGTLLIEAALMAADVAPGLNRTQFGFSSWKQHDDALWQTILEEARTRRENGLRQLPDIHGSDISSKSVNAARENLQAAGLGDSILIEKSDIADCEPGESQNPGLIIMNPPYGERLDAEGGLPQLYTSIGKLMRRAAGWQVAVFTGNPTLTHRFRSTPVSTQSLNNGDIACKLLVFSPTTNDVAKTDGRGSQANRVDGVDMFANRLAKNLKSLRGWAKSAGVECFRVYDADLPEFAIAIDLYPGCDGILRVHVQEYAAPKTVDADLAASRRDAAVSLLPKVLACDPRQIFVKVRTRQRGDQQYEKLARREEFHPVSEGKSRLLVNLSDYHDCGLFLDHRKVRQRISALAQNKRVLNLFCYTGAASVQAAMAGASHVTSIDMSNAYLDWAKENFRENDLDIDQHTFIREDCLEWLESTADGQSFDVILLDPPTFSNSKRMSSTWDVQRDHAGIIEKTMARLTRDGVLLFSTNRKRFKLATELAQRFQCHDISKKTVPRDFARNPNIHHCWEVSFRD